MKNKNNQQNSNLLQNVRRDDTPSGVGWWDVWIYNGSDKYYARCKADTILHRNRQMDRVKTAEWDRTSLKGTKSLGHYRDVIMSAMAFQISGISMVCSTVYSGADQRKHQSSASLVTGEFPSQRANNAENISIWWRHHAGMLQSTGIQMHRQRDWTSFFFTTLKEVG